MLFFYNSMRRNDTLILNASISPLLKLDLCAFDKSAVYFALLGYWYILFLQFWSLWDALDYSSSYESFLSEIHQLQVQAHGSDAMVDEENCVFFLPHRPRSQICEPPFFLFMKGTGKKKQSVLWKYMPCSWLASSLASWAYISEHFLKQVGVVPELITMNPSLPILCH